MWVLPNRYPEIRGAIMRIAKTNTILKRPVNELFGVENTYHDTNQRNNHERKSRYKKSKFYFTTSKNRLLKYDRWRAS